MTRQTSIQLDDDDDRKIKYLQECGYGKQTNILRYALSVLYNRERQIRGEESARGKD